MKGSFRNEHTRINDFDTKSKKTNIRVRINPNKILDKIIDYPDLSVEKTHFRANRLKKKLKFKRNKEFIIN